MLALCTIIYIFFILIDIPKLYFNKKWKLLFIYVSLMLFTYIVHIFYSMGVNIPSPAKPIKGLVELLPWLKK